MGHQKLVDVINKKNAIYAKADFSDEDGIEVSKLEEKFQEMDGWSAEANAADMLCGMGVTTDKHNLLMKDVEPVVKVKTLLAQALFGNPDCLILDEPTFGLGWNQRVKLRSFIRECMSHLHFMIVSHDKVFIRSICQQVIDLDELDNRHVRIKERHVFIQFLANKRRYDYLPVSYTHLTLPTNREV